MGKTKHGFSTRKGRNSTYTAWLDMRNRCYNNKVERYPRYGGRGIEVCDEWRFSFCNFLRDMGAKPDGYSLERKNVDGNYCKENCVWIPIAEQQKNTSRNVFLEHNGERKCLSEWADIFGVIRGTAQLRYHRGKSFEEIFSKTRLPGTGLGKRKNRQTRE